MSAQSFVTGVPLVPDFVRELAVGNLIGAAIPKSLLLWVPVAALILLGLRYSGYGRMLYAVGDNPIACRLAGVRVWQVLLVTYMLCSILAAIGGVLYVGVINAADLQLVSPYLLPSVAAVVIGGTSIFGGIGGYSGTILGAIILVVLDSLLTLLDASQAVKQIIYGSIILAPGVALRHVHQARVVPHSRSRPRSSAPTPSRGGWSCARRTADELGPDDVGGGRARRHAASRSWTRCGAGLDVITDGEQGRFDFNLSFYAYLDGLELESAPRRRWGPPAHDQRGKHRLVGELTRAARARRGGGVRAAARAGVRPARR